MHDTYIVMALGPVIELALAPVFLLAGIGAFLNVMTSRLGRVVDRWRALEAELTSCDDERRRLHVKELGILDRRMAHSNRAIALSTLCFEGPEDELRRTENQQPAILTTSIARSLLATRRPTASQMAD